MSKRLELRFRNEQGRLATISVENPVEPVDPEQVKQAMDTILEQDIFTSASYPLTEIAHAQVVERNVEEVSLD
ncbi:DUF2922 domain-containing protein [Alkalibacillus haloalkaliphilus]|uniref:DUF2922 domain-containing protein n=1 Tax=Alkalibacillus haloalkaliphilus TaxID=94136 RepID=A0A511W5L6_9BACI|nr:DUF2922 domain-containing protein [Alkalibacillus haloalkaliphilus]MDV2582311.1 DUF2922 domain-containing protein [Alkalibacillus haloalkaliphilus]GEN45333.1 hypothetical protein AHA02nite_11090 [Alkalibacillus haloalkaliphilus]